MSRLCVTTYESTSFTYHDKMFVAEASDIQLTGFCRIYDDACDVGLAIVNPRTGCTITFHLAVEKRDPDGDVQVWILRPIPADLRRHPQLAGVSVHILND